MWQQGIGLASSAARSCPPKMSPFSATPKHPVWAASLRGNAHASQAEPNITPFFGVDKQALQTSSDDLGGESKGSGGEEEEGNPGGLFRSDEHRLTICRGSFASPSIGPSGTSCVIPSDIPSSSVVALPPSPAAVAVTQTPLTLVVLLRIGLEACILGMILTALADAVTPLSTIDALVARILVCESGQGATEEVTTLKALIAILRSDVDQLKSTQMSMFFAMEKISDITDMAPTTTENEVRVDEPADLESMAATDEEMIEVAEKASYESLTETEEDMVDAVVQASLVDTPLADPSAATVPFEVTPGTDGHVLIDAPSIESQIDVVT
ncbi:hypothetical protein H5410_050890, partial [Solanum commersonii]